MSETVTFRPAQVFHPVEIIMDELIARGWTLDDLTTRALGNCPSVDPSCASEWGVVRLSWDLYFATAPQHPECLLGDMGEQLERALGIEAAFWERTHNLWRSADESQRSYPPDVECWLSGFDPDEATP